MCGVLGGLVRSRHLMQRKLLPKFKSFMILKNFLSQLVETCRLCRGRGCEAWVL